MRLSFRLNGKQVETDVRPDMLLLDLVRDLGCYSVKRGCETANCGLCTVWLDGKPVLSCSTLAIRADGWEPLSQMKAQSSVVSAIQALL